MERRGLWLLVEYQAQRIGWEHSRTSSPPVRLPSTTSDRDKYQLAELVVRVQLEEFFFVTVMRMVVAYDCNKLFGFHV
jgi:hypothetical protein